MLTVGCIAVAEDPKPAEAKAEPEDRTEVERKDELKTKERPAAASDPIARQWDEAKQTYREQLQKLNEEVLARVASLENKARESGDLARVKQYKAMADAFRDEGTLPSVYNSADYDRKVKVVQEDLRREAKLAIAAYLKEKQDYEAEDLDQELKEILADEGPADSGKRAATDNRKRFMNTSYGALIVHVRGKKWEQIHPETKKHSWWLTETGRDENYIYLHCPDKGQHWRIGEKRMDFIQPDKSWAWLSNGYWEKPDDR